MLSSTKTRKNVISSTRRKSKSFGFKENTLMPLARRFSTGYADENSLSSKKDSIVSQKSLLQPSPITPSRNSVIRAPPRDILERYHQQEDIIKIRASIAEATKQVKQVKQFNKLNWNLSNN